MKARSTLIKVSCISCGMEINIGSGLLTDEGLRPVCSFCLKEDGRMKSFEEKFEDFVKLLVEREKLDIISAKDKAKFMLKQLPAWRNKEA